MLYTVTDFSTGKTDGTLTRGFNAELRGTYIKIVGDAAACGLYFVNVETSEAIKLDNRYISVNEPSRLMIIVPATMSAGTYELRVTTQFSKGATIKKPRSTSLPYAVEIDAGAQYPLTPVRRIRLRRTGVSGNAGAAY